MWFDECRDVYLQMDGHSVRFEEAIRGGLVSVEMSICDGLKRSEEGRGGLTMIEQV